MPVYVSIHVNRLQRAQQRHTCSEVDLLFKRQLLDDFNGFLVRLRPLAVTAAPWTGVLGRRNLVGLGTGHGIRIGRDGVRVGDVGELR